MTIMKKCLFPFLVILFSSFTFANERSLIAFVCLFFFFSSLFPLFLPLSASLRIFFTFGHH